MYAKAAAAPAPTSLLPQPLRHRLCRFQAPHRLQEPPCQLHHHRLPATRRSMHSAEALASQETHVARRTCGACMATNGGRNANLAQRLGMTYARSAAPAPTFLLPQPLRHRLCRFLLHQLIALSLLTVDQTVAAAVPLHPTMMHPTTAYSLACHPWMIVKPSA